MNTLLIVIGALVVGGCVGFFAAAALSMNKTPLSEGEGILKQSPREVVAVYEARREMEELNAPRPPLNLRGGESEREVKAWEKEQVKREKKRRR